MSMYDTFNFIILSSENCIPIFNMYYNSFHSLFIVIQFKTTTKNIKDLFPLQFNVFVALNYLMNNFKQTLSLKRGDSDLTY